MYKALWIDDGHHQNKRLHQYLLEKHSEIELIPNSTQLSETIALLNAEEFDLLFVNPKMKGANAFDLLKAVSPFSFDFIVLAEGDNYVRDAVRFNALDYLSFPIKLEDLEESIQFFYQKKELDKIGNNTSATNIALPTSKGYVFIKPSSIIRCKADGAYTEVLMERSSIIVSKNIKYLEDILISFKFFRVHKSHLINLRHLKEYHRNSAGGLVLLSDGSKIQIAKNRREDFLEVIVD